MSVCVAWLRAACARVRRVVRAPVAQKVIAGGCAVLLLAGAGVVVMTAAANGAPVKAEVTASVNDGYARIVLRFNEDVEANARLSNNIIVIGFRTPIDAAVDRLNEIAPGYVSAARRDPDGRGLRIALARKVTMNHMLAGERLFIDLMPDGWTGPPPSLPQDVVEELAKRAREAERKIRKQQHVARLRQMPLTHVRVGHQPTFSRYIFDLAELVPVAASREKDSLALSFDAPFKFDLADAKSALPPMVAEIDQEAREQSTVVRFAFIGNVDVRTFREDQSFVVDVGVVEAVKRRVDRGPDAAVVSPPASAPAVSPPSAPPPASAPAGTPARAHAHPQAQLEGRLPALPYATTPAAAAPGQPLAGAERKPAEPGFEAPQTVPAAGFGGSPAGQPGAARVAAPSPAAPAEAAPPPVAPPSSPPALASPPAPPPVAPPSSPPALASPPAPPPVAAPSVPPAPAAAPPPVAPLEEVSIPPAKPAESVGPPAGLPVVIADLDLPPDYTAPGTSPRKPDPAPPAKAPALSAASGAATSNPAVSVVVTRQSDNLSIAFPFATPTPAALFQRADTVWAVFDAGAPIDVAPLNQDQSGAIKSAKVIALPGGQAVRIKLARPRLATFRLNGAAPTVVIGDAVVETPRALGVTRAPSTPNRASAMIAFEDPKSVHRLVDPEAGDALVVITALGPPRGFIKSQDFIEFRALPSSQGVAVQPIADDLQVEIGSDRILLSRPGGLALSAGDPVNRRGGLFRPALFDAQLWGFDREADFDERRSKLAAAAAEGLETKRTAARLDLARFYLANALYPEAKGVLDVAISEERPNGDDVSGLVMRAFANVMVGRVEEALKDLGDPIVSDLPESQLWRALAFARSGRWREAHENFGNPESAMATLPIELQRIVLKEAVRASIEVRDFASAANGLHVFETLGAPKEMEAALAVLSGRVAEGLGRGGDALVAYRLAAVAAERPAAAQGRLRETVLRYQLGDLKRAEVIADLEELTTIWRGDETEIEALQALARLYTEEARYRDAFHVMRTALMAHPNSDMTRRLQEEAAATFDALFLAGKGDALPAIEALGLFYDYRELTPIGRRGDEMIRRLADRLAAVDLLDQASELLQHQVDHRLQGAARAQVAIRLAVIYLMARKPDRALAALHATQTSYLATELRAQRLLIEARALSDIGRADLALELIANIEGREATRLRSDIFWAAKRWRDAAEQIELLYGDRWSDWQPFAESERADLLRAAVAYALAQDQLGLGRFRERYAAKMVGAVEGRTFEVATGAAGTNAAEFRAIARAIAATDTLEGFLRDMRARYPETGSFSPPPQFGAAAGAGGQPAAEPPPGGQQPAATAPTSAKPAGAAPSGT